jgi:hypothetical protein
LPPIVIYKKLPKVNGHAFGKNSPNLVTLIELLRELVLELRLCCASLTLKYEIAAQRRWRKNSEKNNVQKKLGEKNGEKKNL